MKRTSVIVAALSLVVAGILLTGCYLPAAPDVTPTPSQGDLELTQMAELSIEAEQTQLPTPPPTPTAEPTAVPTVEPTQEVTAMPTQEATAESAQEATLEPTQAPTQPPTAEPTQEAPPPSTTETSYTVQAGDNLFRIALRYGLSMEELAAYNNITNPALIYVGQELRIPAGTEVTPPQPAAGEILYTVQAGDNLFRIALRYNLSYLYLASYNGISNPHSIYVGQTIRIPPAP